MPARIGYHKSGPAAAPTARADYEARPDRQADRNFYSASAWRRCRAAYLAANPLCADCPRPTPAVHVHHLEERKDRPELAYDHDNLQALCLRCHNAKRRRS